MNMPAAPKTAPKTASGAPKLAPGGAATTLPAVRASGAVALPADLVADLAQHAKDAAAKERPSVAKISFRNGVMTYLSSEVPGNSMDMILLSTAFRNTWYPQPWDPNNLVNPACFAISLTG